MDIEVKKVKDFWAASLTVTSGNKYSCSTVFYNKPSEIHILELWKASKKYFTRC